MSDLELRIAMVSGAILVALLVTVVLRIGSSGPSRRVSGIDLAPGTHFFSSASCGQCSPARRLLIEHFGTEGFSEHEWEREPGLFQAIGIDAVPATLLVDSGGSGTLWPGMPVQMFSSLDP